MNKKGASLSQMYPAVLAIIMVGIALGIGIYILSETSNAISNVALTVTNESGINATGGASLSHASDCGADNFVVTSVNNHSDVITSTYYTVDADLGTITNTSSDYQSTLWNVSYTYDGATDLSTTSYCGVLDTTGTGIGGFASWVAVIVVVLAAAVVLGIVINSFGRRNAV